MQQLTSDDDLEWKWTSVSRFQVWLVSLNPTKGKEINKTRPCVVISPNEMMALSTVLVAPMTTKGFDFSSQSHV